MARRRLNEIELSPGSRIARLVLFWAIATCSAIAAITYVMPSHRLSYELELHSGYADTGPIPLLGLLGLAGLAVWLSRKRFGAGIILAIAAAIGSFLEFANTVLQHLFSSAIFHAPEFVHLVVLVGMFGASVLLLVLEPVVYLVERSSQEKAEEASFPTARVINT